MRHADAMCLLILAAQIENNLVLVCANVPTLRALFRKTPASSTSACSGNNSGAMGKRSRDIALVRTLTIDETDRDDKDFEAKYSLDRAVEPAAYS